jgi:hypothetical protein
MLASFGVPLFGALRYSRVRQASRRRDLTLRAAGGIDLLYRKGLLIDFLCLGFLIVNRIVRSSTLCLTLSA